MNKHRSSTLACGLRLPQGRVAVNDVVVDVLLRSLGGRRQEVLLADPHLDEAVRGQESLRPRQLRTQTPRHAVRLNQAVLVVHRVNVQIRPSQVPSNLLDLG